MISCLRCGVPLRKKDIRETENHCAFCSKKLNLDPPIEHYQQFHRQTIDVSDRNWKWSLRSIPIDSRGSVSTHSTHYDMDRYDILDRMVRAGDVLLYPIDEIPYQAQEISNPILAYGEASGHKHLVKGQVQVFETPEPREMKTLSFKSVLANKFIKVLESTLLHPTVLVHENKQGKQADHLPKTVKPGNYMVLREEEWQPFEEMVKQVED